MGNQISMEMLKKIEEYWSRRANSYSEEVRYEMEHENEEKWMEVLLEHIGDRPGCRVLDIGTGPGFFAIGLAKRGYQVTAVDYTPNMLEQARQNAGAWGKKIHFLRMDAQKLDFADESFDVVVTRDLTWNLERPQAAYQEWNRVLKKGGLMMNFDAAWYSYLFDEKKAEGFQQDRQNVKAKQIKDFDAYPESDQMEEISRHLLLSRLTRPEADVEMLKRAGFKSILTDTKIGERVWDEREKINYASRPMFMICAYC